MVMIANMRNLATQDPSSTTFIKEFLPLLGTLTLLILLFWQPTCSLAAPANTYYIDALNGNDTHAGTSPNTAWQTMSRVSGHTFSPGDQILFRRGQQFIIDGDGMFLQGDGQATNRITLGAYGPGTSLPVLTNTNAANKYIYVVGVWGKYWTIRDIKIDSTNGNIIEDGIRVWDNGTHVIIDNVEITGVAKGIKLHGSHSEVKNSYIHDLVMLINTPGGDDDVGAIGIEVTQNGSTVSDVKIHHNRLVNLIQPSYDYGRDGAALELFDNIDGVTFYNNWVENVDSLTELGASSPNKVIQNVVLHHNVVVNPRIISFIHNSGPLGVTIYQIKIDNNTIVKKEDSEKDGYGIGFAATNANNDQFYLRNNIISYHNTASAFAYNGGNFTHSHNLYYLTGIGPENSAAPNYPLGTGELMASPDFPCDNNDNFHLQPSSPAIDSALDLGYAHDYNSVFYHEATLDIGAFIYIPKVCQSLYLPFVQS
jgi:hypothetical protein